MAYGLKACSCHPLMRSRGRCAGVLAQFFGPRAYTLCGIMLRTYFDRAASKMRDDVIANLTSYRLYRHESICSVFLEIALVKVRKSNSCKLKLQPARRSNKFYFTFLLKVIVVFFNYTIKQKMS